MADLTLDLKLLEQLKEDLESVVREFTDADDFSDEVAEATGHDGLHGHVRDFAHKWNDKRKGMTENVSTLQGQIASISDGFSKTDEGLAAALEQSAASSPTAYPQPK
jgi:hypothetical protein